MKNVTSRSSAITGTRESCRRTLFQRGGLNSGGIRRSILCIAFGALFCSVFAIAVAPSISGQNLPSTVASISQTKAPFLPAPIWVYNNWSSYDELSDNIPLTESLAMRELDEVIRLRRLGVKFDYYMMDAFWFDPDGGYRRWRKPNWPNGPDAWIAKCKANGIRPGLWFSTNTLVKLNAVPTWRDSLNSNGSAMSFSEGGFLADFMSVLQYWYDRGIRMFKFDFVDFQAATQRQSSMSAMEVRERNVNAFREALLKFRAKNPDVVLEGFNGFGGDLESTSGPFPFRNPVDPRWLDVFDAIYSGDPRPSDVPEMNFWRSVDIYGDHMVRRFEQSGFPLDRIDSTAFMIGNTGTIYYRKTAAWKGMLLLMVARGGWINTVHGNLEFLSDEQARWFARVQSLFAGMQQNRKTSTFGGIPGEIQPYGFSSADEHGELFTVVNPAQAILSVDLPTSRTKDRTRVLFHDSGFVPKLKGRTVTLGPGELALVGFGRYAKDQFGLGIEEDVRIPVNIQPVNTDFRRTAKNEITTRVVPPANRVLRIIFQQLDKDGRALRSWPGGPPNGKPVGTVLAIRAFQAGKPIPVSIDYDRVIWSGLSWGAGEITPGTFDPKLPIEIRCSSSEKEEVTLAGRLFSIEY